jgi:hypothetical protein
VKKPLILNHSPIASSSSSSSSSSQPKTQKQIDALKKKYLSKWGKAIPKKIKSSKFHTSFFSNGGHGVAVLEDTLQAVLFLF